MEHPTDGPSRVSHLNEMIHGVELKALKSHPDDRGFFREIIRNSEEIFRCGTFAQWSHSKMERGVVKAWHYHHIQTDWWYVAVGQLEVVLFDNRRESPTYQKKMVFFLGEQDCFGDETLEACLRIPPGVLHGAKVLSHFAHLLYITSETYNPDDEGRFPFDSDIVGHDWGEGVITSELDRKHFVPTAERVRGES